MKVDSRFTIDSNNVIEVIRPILNFLFFFYKKISQAQKSAKPLNSEQKIKNTHKKHLRGKKSHIPLFAFYAFSV